MPVPYSGELEVVHVLEVPRNHLVHCGEGRGEGVVLVVEGIGRSEEPAVTVTARIAVQSAVVFDMRGEAGELCVAPEAEFTGNLPIGPAYAVLSGSIASAVVEVDEEEVASESVTVPMFHRSGEYLTRCAVLGEVCLLAGSIVVECATEVVVELDILRECAE